MAARRAKGEGSIVKRSDGLWMGRYGGKSVYGHTKAEASDKLIALRINLQTAEASINSISMEDGLREWMVSKSKTVKPSSLDRIEQIVEKHFIPQVGAVQCADFTEKIFESQIIARMISSGLSYSSIKKAQDNMMAFCRWATSRPRQYMSRNPLDSYEKLSKKAFTKELDVSESNVAESSFISEEDRARFVLACRSKFSSGNPRFKYGDAYIFDMYTGLRMGELLALTCDDIDFDRRTVRVAKGLSLVKDRDPKSKTYGKKVFKIFPYTKTFKPRVIPLGDMAYEAAKRICENHTTDSKYFVSNYKGDVVQFCTFSSMLTRVFDLAEISVPKGSNVHALRHTFASMCFAAGMPVRTVSELLGHSSVQITMDTYIHLIQKYGVIHVPELVNLK